MLAIPTNEIYRLRDTRRPTITIAAISSLEKLDSEIIRFSASPRPERLRDRSRDEQMTTPDHSPNFR